MPRQFSVRHRDVLGKAIGGLAHNDRNRRPRGRQSDRTRNDGLNVRSRRPVMIRRLTVGLRVHLGARIGRRRSARQAVQIEDCPQRVQAGEGTCLPLPSFERSRLCPALLGSSRRPASLRQSESSTTTLPAAAGDQLIEQLGDGRLGIARISRRSSHDHRVLSRALLQLLDLLAQPASLRSPCCRPQSRSAPRNCPDHGSRPARSGRWSRPRFHGPSRARRSSRQRRCRGLEPARSPRSEPRARQSRDARSRPAR